MANFLYTITAHSNYDTWQSSVEGVSIVNSYDNQINQMVQSPNMLIEAPGTPYDGAPTGVVGQAQNPSVTDRAIFTRVSNGGANAYNNTGFPYFSVLIGDRATSPVGSWDALIGANNDEADWVGNTPSLTWHTPYIGIEVYTLIVPTDNVIYQSATQRIGNVLVWHIPFSLLGVYGQNANLPFRSADLPEAIDTDAKAGGKIWGMGFGLIYGTTNPGDTLPYINLSTI